MLKSENHYFNSNNSITINTNDFTSNDLELFVDYLEKSQQPSFYYKNEFNLGKVDDFEFSSTIDYSNVDELNEQTFITESDFGDLFNYFDEPSILINDDDEDIFNLKFQKKEIQLKVDNRKMIRKKKMKKRNNAVVLFNSIKDKIEFFDEIARKKNDKKIDSIEKVECLPIKSICSPPPTINRKKMNKAKILKEAEELWKISLFKVSILNALLMIDYLPKSIKKNQLNFNPSLDLVDFYQKPNLLANKNDFFYSFDFFSLLKYQELYGNKVEFNQFNQIDSNLINYYFFFIFSHQKMNYKKIMINQIHYQNINYVFKHLCNV